MTPLRTPSKPVLIIRRRSSTLVWCRECGCEVDMVGLGEDGVLTGMSGQALRDFAQSRGWHIVQGYDGAGLICLESLLKSK